MRALSYGQRSFMSTHLADGLRQLGIDVAPQALERELKELDRAAGDYTPPKPYAAWIDAMHAETNPNPYPSPVTRPAPLDANGVPDAYARDIAKKENR